MKQFPIILFMVILLGTPLLVGYGLRQLVNWRNPQNIIRSRAFYVRLVAQVLCLLGAVVAVLFLQLHMLSHAASLLLGAAFFWPGLLILAYIGRDSEAQAPANESVGAADASGAGSDEGKPVL